LLEKLGGFDFYFFWGPIFWGRATDAESTYTHFTHTHKQACARTYQHPHSRKLWAEVGFSLFIMRKYLGYPFLLLTTSPFVEEWLTADDGMTPSHDHPHSRDQVSKKQTVRSEITFSVTRKICGVKSKRVKQENVKSNFTHHQFFYPWITHSMVR
jgi:hypothetical protein